MSCHLLLNLLHELANMILCEALPSIISFLPTNLVCGMVHIKDTLLLIAKSSPCGDVSLFSIKVYEWSFTTCPTPYNRK